MSRFEAVGNFVYEKGDRIGCTPAEAAVELARKLNAYQMRVERFKAEIEQLKATDIVVQASVSVGKTPVLYLAENARLKAEVERLTKAGDELWEFAKLADTNAPKARRKALKDWNAAKEGKQP